MKKNVLLILLVPVLYFSFQGCVETITDPPDKLAPRVEVWLPATDDTVKNGRNYITYYAEDDKGLYYCEVYLNGVLHLRFDADSTHTMPKIYFWIDESLVGSKISYFVKAYDLAGNESRSEEMSNILVIENTSPPETPEDFTASRVNDNIVMLTWTDVSDHETGFEIWRRTSESTSKLFRSVEANTKSFSDSTAASDKIYYYKICAINKFGKSSFSSEINSAGIGPLSTPGNFSGTALGTNQIKLTWTDKSTQETKFRIQRKNTGDTYFSDLVYVDSNKTEYIDKYSMYAGGSYTYRIAATNKTSSSDWSPSIDVITLSENVSTPANLTAVLQVSSKSVKLTWDDYGNTAVEAKIERKNPNSSFALIGSTTASLKSYEDKTVTGGNSYTYRVRTITSQGNYSSYSNEASIEVPVIPPNAPTNLKLAKFSDVSFNLSWTDNSDDENGFQLWRSDGTVNDFKIIRQLPANSFSINDEVSNASVIYYYKIRAFRDTTFSEFSNIINSTGGSGVYPRPDNFTATAFCPTKVLLTWKDNTVDELGFRIERKTAWGTYTEIALLPPNTNTYTDESGLSAGIEFIYRIKVFSSTQESDWSDEIHVMMPSDGDCGG